ncbi:MAG: hypothetical protein C0601_07330 [Candidatus Muiribacterium halophilum]|uniref:MobA-like NTP transferase domain-containing protein n=1 Tax=Muiribacterium halophilum TaxID=2053465 RepID=A0A2N5ZFZ1_MUIH1|nr:MAG: hypothetical protein C0601_07330 [Candidatus Muirbacterium halophilum]
MIFTGLIIAGGYSNRFKGFKPLANINGESFLSNICIKLHGLSKNTVIVTGHKHQLIEDHIKEKDFLNTFCINNKDFKKGMSSSILIGLKHIKERFPESHTIYQPVDIPHIAPDTYFKLIQTTKERNPEILKPSYNMKGGHPLIISPNTRDILIERLREDNLKIAIKKIGIKMEYLNTDDISVIQDIDTPEDLDNYLSDIRFIPV